MIIEIGFTYQYDKHSPVETSWTYFYVKGDDLEKAKTKAKTYWKKFITELGWTKKAKLTHIEEIQNGKNYTPAHVIVDTRELPPARERRSTQQSTRSSTRTRSVSHKRAPQSQTKTRKSVRNKT
jgi:hypothetical protein